jgi:hypothetical protein
VLRLGPAACLLAVVLLAGCGGGREATPDTTATTTARTVDRPPPAKHAHPRTDPAWTALRLPRVPAGPVPGYVLIADRNNDRLLLVSPAKKVVWHYDGLRGPDDAFFTPG